MWPRLGLALAMLLLLGGAALEEEMSAREFEQAGLDKLTDEEAGLPERVPWPAGNKTRRQLWQRAGQTGGNPPGPGPGSNPATPCAGGSGRAAKRGRSQARAAPHYSFPESARIVGRGEGNKKQNKKQQLPSIHTRIKGEFNGWSGQTLFVLENGQRWRQRVSGVYRHRAQSPAVTIIKGRFGYYLIVDKTKRRIGVKRVL